VPRAQLLAAFSVGSEIIWLRGIARSLELGSALDRALAAIGRGNSAAATAQLGRLDHDLTSMPRTGAAASLVLGIRARILALSEVLTDHAEYFDAGVRG
jgi:hypothetical protein